jgi:hypothetical protein
VSRIVHKRVLVMHTGGTDVHQHSGASSRPDGTLRVYDADGVERRIYAKGYWLRATNEGNRETANR